MDMITAYTLLDGGGEGATVEEHIEAAKVMLANPAVLSTAPGRVGRAVRDIVIEFWDVEEDFE